MEARDRRAVGTFPNRSSAEQALRALQESGFEMNKISVVARHNDEIAGTHVEDASEKASERSAGGGAVAGTQAGGVVGGVIGLLAGASALAVPGVGPLLAGGALATVLSSTIVGSAAGASVGALAGALAGYGIPSDEARDYERLVSEGSYLVIVEGTESDLSRAETILHNRGIQNYRLYDRPSRTLEDQRSDSPLY